jgi:glycerol-3-phosphate acyltransferase PlsX
MSHETIFAALTASEVVISIDAMGSDSGPASVVAGLALSAIEFSNIFFIVHGDEATLTPLISALPVLKERVTLAHAPRVVTMDDKPSQVMRHGEGTSMWSCIDSVKKGEATGNTGALMALSMIKLRKLPNVNRPAIACLWPSYNAGGFNVMLDVGADIKADAADLLQYATMGVAYARSGLNLAKPRVGLLNVGTEEHKGRIELKLAHKLITAAAQAGNYKFIGFVEGSDIPGKTCDVIVTDGFTGNIALKTGEGTAKLLSDFMREAFSVTFLSKITALMSINSLKRLRRRMDTRRVNGGVFLGLNGTVVKSHGSADATGVAAAVRLAYQLAASNFIDDLARQVASANEAGKYNKALEKVPPAPVNG